MASLPRILVIDPIGRLGGIVKSGMTMLDRPHVMVEVPTIQDAIDEISTRSLNLVVTAYFLGENQPNGIDLAERAIREQAGTPIVIMADEFDAPPDPSRLSGKPFQYLTYPPGEQFFRALRIGLDGEEVVQVQEGASGEFDIGPIPAMDVEATQKLLHPTLINMGAIAAFVCERSGKILAEEGAMGYIDKTVVATTLAPLFPRAIKIAPQIGGQGWAMQHFDGERYDIFALALGYHHFLVFLFEGDNRAAIGEVMRYRRRGIEEFINLIGDDAWSYQEVIVPETVDATTPPEPIVEKRSTITMSALDLDEAKESPLSILDDEPFLEPVKDLDVDLLFGDVDDDLADLFSGDLLEDDGVFDIATGDGVSFDEAQNMGLLGE
jgi:hypothetical protein